MRKTLMAAVAAIALIGAGVHTATSGEWIAVAANHQGYGYGEGYSEESARDEAIYDCEVNTGFDCTWQTTSVPTIWYLSVVYCDGEPMTAGSRHGWDSSEALAVQKLDDQGVRTRRCSLEAQY